MAIRFILAVAGLSGAGILGLPQTSFAETKPLTDASSVALDVPESTPFDDRTPQFGVVLPEGRGAAASPPTTIPPAAGDGASKPKSGAGGDMASIVQSAPENAGLDDPSRVAAPPQSQLRQFLSALIQLGSANR